MKRYIILVVMIAEVLHQSNGFDLPNIGDFFQRLSKKETNSKVDPRERGKDDNVKRTKRQSPNIGDESQLPHEARSSALPMMPNGEDINFRYMPTLGNGHIATTVFDKSIHMNGLYNGVGGNSHRAKIPALIMSRVYLPEDQERMSTRRFVMNVQDGVFMETIDAPFAFIEHRIYTHHRYIRTFISDIYAKRKTGVSGGGVIQLKYPALKETPDIDFDEPRRHHNNWRASGRTKESEDGTAEETIHIYWQHRVVEIPLIGGTTHANVSLIMSVDRHEASARSDYDRAVAVTEAGNNGHYNLLREHIEAWHRTWDHGRIDLEGDVLLGKVTRFSQYYLLSSLPSLFPAQGLGQADYLHGMGRTSLAKGSDQRNYKGHIMWDSEMYIMPALLLFFPDHVKSMLRYRAEKSEQAQEIAASMGSGGYKYPWASAASGNEVSPDVEKCGADCVLKRHHNTGAISWAIRQYYSATRDRDFVTSGLFNSCDMTREIARFFAERAIYNPINGRYDMTDMTGPDLFHPDVDNNAYTVVLASLAIHWARYYACICNRHAHGEVPDEWIQKALYLNLPYNNVKRLHHQFQGFLDTIHRPISQADTVMLTYPLNWNMSRDIMRNDLQLYEQIIDERSPAMTWSFFTVGWKWVGDEARLRNTFLRSYQNYLITPFYLWTEYSERSPQDQEEGSVNYLPGMGGFLQSLIYGFAGVRVRPQYLEFHDPRPPQGTVRLRLHNFKYLGARMTILIEDSRVEITVHSIHDIELVLSRNDTFGQTSNLVPGAVVRIDNPRAGFFISSRRGVACPHPRDYIYMPWGYSPWISKANLVYHSFLYLYFSIAIILYQIIGLTWDSGL